MSIKTRKYSRETGLTGIAFAINSFTLSVSLAILNGNEEEVEDEIEDIDPHQPVGDDEDTEISFAFPFTLSNGCG